MNHGVRAKDYGSKIPEDEPVFLIRAQDACSVGAVEAWANLAVVAGASEDIVREAYLVAHAMRGWQEANGKYTPDL